MWFWTSYLVDGICMNCRRRPGLQDPIGGYYSCQECRALVCRALESLTESR